MVFQLFLIILLSLCVNGLFNHSQTNSTFDIELYQCDTNNTILNNTLMTIDKISGSCDIDCCTKNNSNQTIPAKICQVTLQSSENVCLARRCYSSECNQVSLLTINITSTTKNPIDSLFSLSSFVNQTHIIWPVWKDKSTLSIRSSILILLLIANLCLTSITLYLVIRSIIHARMIAQRKAHRYSLF